MSVCLRVRKRERFVDCLFITQLCCCSIVESNVKKLSRFQVEKKRGRRKMALKEEIIFKQNFGRKKALFRQIYHKSISVFMFFSVKWPCIAIRLWTIKPKLSFISGFYLFTFRDGCARITHTSKSVQITCFPHVSSITLHYENVRLYAKTLCSIHHATTITLWQIQ